MEDEERDMEKGIHKSIIWIEISNTTRRMYIREEGGKSLSET